MYIRCVRVYWARRGGVSRVRGNGSGSYIESPRLAKKQAFRPPRTNRAAGGDQIKRAAMYRPRTWTAHGYFQAPRANSAGICAHCADGRMLRMTSLFSAPRKSFEAFRRVGFARGWLRVSWESPYPCSPCGSRLGGGGVLLAGCFLARECPALMLGVSAFEGLVWGKGGMVVSAPALE